MVLKPIMLNVYDMVFYSTCLYANKIFYLLQLWLCRFDLSSNFMLNLFNHIMVRIIIIKIRRGIFKLMWSNTL